MKTISLQRHPQSGWNWPSLLPDDPALVLYFGSASQLADGAAPVRELTARYPRAVVCGCSTAGEIWNRRVSDDSVVAALVWFDSTQVRAVAETITRNADSRAVGHRTAARLPAAGLRHVLVLSEGLSVNGTALMAGFREVLPAGVAITGGLAGDGSRFQNTFVGLGDVVQCDQVVAIGFYGPDVVVGYGSKGGWEAFGPRRRITRSEGNTLFELDGQPALPLYQRYLGERAAGLPATGLLFPLELTRDVTAGSGLVRTILAVDEVKQSLTFAGDMPQDWYARLMKADAGQLVDGAANAGSQAAHRKSPAGSLAILVSCVGRRLVLGQRIEEELEAVMETLPADTEAVGFYSYGEAYPSEGSAESELHNQTMTVTLIGEKS